jgi:hypothetical protein
MRWLALVAVAVAIVTSTVLLTRHERPKEGTTSRAAQPPDVTPGRREAACGSKTADVARAPQEPRLFSPDSVWNRPLAPNAAAGDQTLAKTFKTEVEREIGTGTGPWIQTSNFSTPLYTVGPAQRCVRVVLDVTEPYGRTLQRAFRRVPLPADARPAAGTDGHLTVWQPATDSLWEFWKLRREGGTWHAAWGGAMQGVSRSPGYFTRSAWPGARAFWGATATSLPAVAGTMMIRELEQGRIPHALAISVPDARAGVYAFPARRTDGTLRDPAAIPEGARFRVDPRVDLEKLSMPRTVRVIARAAQRYGMIVRDKTSSAVGLYAEDPTQFPHTDPYARLFEGKLPSVLLKSFPWQHVQALPVRLRRADTS